MPTHRRKSSLQPLKISAQLGRDPAPQHQNINHWSCDSKNQDCVWPLHKTQNWWHLRWKSQKQLVVCQNKTQTIHFLGEKIWTTWMIKSWNYLKRFVWGNISNMFSSCKTRYKNSFTSSALDSVQQERNKLWHTSLVFSLCGCCALSPFVDLAYAATSNFLHEKAQPSLHEMRHSCCERCTL